ncbi:MAG: DNA-binding protein [Candidatus Bathyarchaeota archaeon]|nr:DNA-binding protein [Candidatus Bathyarchaeota archaeon]
MSDEELDAIRRRKLSAMQQRAASDEQKQQMQAEQQIEAQKQALLKQILSPEARQRLTNLKMVKPEFTDNLELQLIQLAQMGKVPVPMSDAQLKQILIQLQSRKRETRITRI